MSEDSTAEAEHDPAAGQINPYSELVRVRVDGVETNMGRYLAEANGIEILDDEPIRTEDGRLRDDTRSDGRDLKSQTTVAKEAAAKKAASSANDEKEKTK